MNSSFLQLQTGLRNLSNQCFCYKNDVFLLQMSFGKKKNIDITIFIRYANSEICFATVT